MRKLKRFTQHIYQNAYGIRTLFLIVGIQSGFTQLDIPVAKLIPDKFV